MTLYTKTDPIAYVKPQIWMSSIIKQVVANQATAAVMARLASEIIALFYLFCPLPLRKPVPPGPSLVAFTVLVLRVTRTGIDGFPPIGVRRATLPEQRMIFTLHLFAMLLPLLANPGIRRLCKTFVPRLLAGHSASILVTLHATRSTLVIRLIKKFMQIRLPDFAATCAASWIVTANVNTLVGNVDVNTGVLTDPF